MDALSLATTRQAAIQERFVQLISAFRPSVICDIGSLNGVDAISFKRASPGSIVFAFEANINNYGSGLVSSNFAAAGVSWNYLALGDRIGTAVFNILPVNTEGYDWRAGASSLLRCDTETTTPMTVPILTLDHFLEDRGLLQNGKALWIDVEGAADLVLAGATESLKRTQFLKIEVEKKAHWIGQRLASEILKPLKDLGFVQIASSEVEEISQFDVLLVHAEISLATKPIMFE